MEEWFWLQVTARLEEEQDGVDDELIIPTQESCDLFDQLLDMIIGATQRFWTESRAAVTTCSLLEALENPHT